MLPKIRAEFRILGTQLSPNEITKKIDIIPTRTWKFGDSIQRTALRRKHNGWCLATDCNDVDLAKSAESLLRILLPKAREIVKMCQEYQLHCELSYALYIVDDSPPINFRPNIISGLADLNATLDIDIILIAE